MRGVVGISIVGRVMSSFSYSRESDADLLSPRGKTRTWVPPVSHPWRRVPRPNCRSADAWWQWWMGWGSWGAASPRHPGDSLEVLTVWEIRESARWLLIVFIKSINSDGWHEFTTQVLVWFKLWIQLRLLLWFLRIQAWTGVNYLTIYISG